MALAYPHTLTSSDDSYSFTESILTTSSSSTVWGPGALTGKVLKLFGEKCLDTICFVVIHRRLAFIKETLEKKPHVLTNPHTVREWQRRNAIYADLKEVCRGPYALSLRQMAANLLRDVVARIARSVPEAFFDALECTHTRLTSLLCTPTHTQWASLLSRLQRREPHLFGTHGPLISVSQWATVTFDRKSAQEHRPVYKVNDNSVAFMSGCSAADLGTQGLAPGIRTIQIAVTVEVKQTYELQDDSRRAKALAFRTRLFKILRSRNPSYQTSEENEIPHNHSLVDSLAAKGEIPYAPKVLLLGTGGAGKSTLLKQQKSGWHNPHLSREIILYNVIASMKCVLQKVRFSDLSHSMILMEAKRYIIELQWSSYEVDVLSSEQLQEVGSAICMLWAEPVLRNIFQRKKGSLTEDLFVAPDSVEYFCDSADRIFAPNYEPTHEDTLRSRVPTTGIHETVIQAEYFAWRFIDAGGERSERRKWVHAFEDATAILFVVALADYNKLLYEDSTVSRMDDSLTLFDSIANSPRFENTLIMLIFNKGDVFTQELEIAPLKEWMPDYQGETYADACKYIERRFTDLIKDKNRALRTHYTTAIDEKAMSDKFAVIRHEITQHHQQLEKQGQYGFSLFGSDKLDQTA